MEEEPQGDILTLEFIAEALRGPAFSHCGGGTAVAATQGQPTLGLRLLDFAPSLVEALAGERYGPSKDDRVSFAGRGKALVFELPDELSGAVPLWLLALASQPDAQAAVLLASACVDLREDVAAALQDAPTKASAYRRCGFKLQPVQDAGCSLFLDCYLRVYAGERQVIGGSLLEPSLLQPLEPAAQLRQPPLAPTTAKCAEAVTQTEEQDPAKDAVQVETGQPAVLEQRSALPTDAKLLGSPSLAERTACTALPGPGSRGREAATPASCGRLPSAARGAVFGEEICLGAAASPVAETPGPGACALTMTSQTPGSGLRGEPPEVASSLQMVSALVRELWQINSIN